MNLTVTKNNKKKIQIKNVISSKKIKKKIFKKLLLLKKNTIIDGFRKGKAPIQLIKKKFKKNIIKEILEKIINKNFLKYIKKKNIKKYSNVQYFLEKYKKGIDLNYTIEFNINYHMLLKKLKKIKLCKLNIKVKKKDINKLILNFQKNISKWISKDGLIKEHNKVYINFKLLSKNKKVIIKKNNFQIIMNKNFLLKKIYKKLINKKKNDKIIVKIKFSKYHPEKKITEKINFFIIKILKIKKKENNKINFKKIQNLGLQIKNIKELKKNILLNLKEESKKITEENLKNQFTKKWNKIFKKKFSKQEKINQIRIIKKNIFLKYKKQNNIFKKSYNINIIKKSKIELKTNYILNKIITNESLFISNQVIKQIYQQTIKNFYKNKLDKTEKNILKNNIRKILLINKAFSFIFKYTFIKNKNCSFNKAFKIHKNIQL
ncbi:MAG: hypothetical protein G8D27_01330 [Buchnera aphidicola (Periphyllus aceris)]|nr:hypothetical protein [Buchnera aphidicola (Periphyllus aceris)]